MALLINGIEVDPSSLAPTIYQLEKQWRNDELHRTDAYIVLPDFPYSTALATYRQELRDYSFDGNRPALPVNSNGKPIA